MIKCKADLVDLYFYLNEQRGVFVTRDYKQATAAWPVARLIDDINIMLINFKCIPFDADEITSMMKRLK